MDPDPEVGAVDREMRCTRVAALGPGDRTRVLVTNEGEVGVGRGGPATHPRMVLRAESRLRHVMFSRMVDCSPSLACPCASSHCTTVWLLSHR